MLFLSISGSFRGRPVVYTNGEGGRITYCVQLNKNNRHVYALTYVVDTGILAG